MLVILAFRMSFAGYSWLNIYSSKMKAFSTVAYWLFAAGLIQTAVGLNCDSGCVACWKDGASGVDAKFSCPDGYHCGDGCPSGYSGLHCARETRCK